MEGPGLEVGADDVASREAEVGVAFDEQVGKIHRGTSSTSKIFEKGAGARSDPRYHEVAKGPPMERPVLIEATAKKYKSVQVLAAAFIVFGLAALFAGAGTLITVGLFLVGLGALTYGRFGAWWHHG
jgi:hypothetical protein